MDILNFISWIKRGDYKAVLPTDTINLIAVGSKDPQRGDDYKPLSVNAAPLQSLYNTGAVTQITSISTPVTLNVLNGVITTVSSTLAVNATTAFVVNNSNVTTSSKILLTVQYAGAAQGIPDVSIYALTNGTFTIKLGNVGSTSLNNVVKVHFLIIA
jgi:hypothetical protein